MSEGNNDMCAQDSVLVNNLFIKGEGSYRNIQSYGKQS
jgi:hypothetical protein